MNFETAITIKECSKCNRKILIERSLFGISHTASIGIVCWDCLSDKEKKKVEDYIKKEKEDQEKLFKKGLEEGKKFMKEMKECKS